MDLIANPLQNVYVIMRCCRWRDYVRWEAGRLYGPNPAPQMVRSWWFKLVMMTKVQQSGLPGRDLCPVDVVEALETGRCVKALREHLRLTVVEEYLVGGSALEKARALGIDDSTFRRRRSSAHVELLDKFNAAGASLSLEDAEEVLRGRPPILPRVAVA